MTDQHQRHAPHVVLCGSLRAGTTLLRVMLAQHSQLTGRGESDFLFDEAPDGSSEALEAFKDRVEAHRIPRAIGIGRPEGGTYEDVVSDMLARHQAPTERQLLTLHRNFDRAAELLPNAFFIRLQRDPRDVAVSAAKMGWFGIPYFALQVWLDAEEAWQKALPRIPAERRIFVTYEELIDDPRGIVGGILEKAGLPFEDTALSPPESSTYSAPEARPREAFRKSLSDREVAEINSRLAHLEDDYGYDLEPKSRPTPARERQLFLQRKLASLRFRVRRFGLPLVVQDEFARRFGLSGLQARTAKRIEAIQIAHLK